MSVEQAIHEHWGGYAPLTRLVPLSHVYTGTVPREDEDGNLLAMPWVSLEPVGDSKTERTSSGNTITAGQLRIHVYAEKHTTAQDVAEAVMDHFDRADFYWSRGRVLDMKHESKSDVEEDDGVWHTMLDYTVRVTREAGA